MNPLLDNIAWHTLAGPHARFADGGDNARRYARGFSPIIAFRNAESPDFADLADCCEQGEQFYCVGWSGPDPADWRVEAESTMFNMVWQGRMPTLDEAPEALPLGADHVEQAMELTALTHPGPFGPRTIELGDYFGCFEGRELVAMAGERMHAGRLREISGVCTKPGFQGRGYARRLMLKLIRRQMQRDETPFLHVMSDNAQARRLYNRMGFVDYREPVVRVVRRR